jgi:flavin reductase (DIM6/NTAB) family NADH-FMN oxidoreductase RutF
MKIMAKVVIAKDLFCLPWTQTILGTHFQDRPNFMALDWLTRVNYQPPMLGICVNRTHASSEAISKTGEFSISVPSEDMIEITDYTGIVSGKKVDKSELFEVFYGELMAAPMIRTCALTLECKVAQTIELPTNNLFIGEIVNIYAEESVLKEGKPDYELLKPFLLSMPDNTYWSLGKRAGKAWSDGLALRGPLKEKE